MPMVEQVDATRVRFLDGRRSVAPFISLPPGVVPCITTVPAAPPTAAHLITAPSAASPSITAPPADALSFDADALFARALGQAGIGAWTCDLGDGALGWTQGVYELFGLSPDGRLDRRETVQLYDEESRETMERLRADAIAQARGFTMEAQIVRPDGTRRWMRLSADVVKDNHRITRLFGLKQDITDEKRRWDALRQLAERDALTGLVSRAVYQTVFLNAPRAQPGVTPLGALVLFDLDGFKQVNDRFGHAAGDACLRVAAERLALAFRDAPMVARIGGDEFAVLVDAGIPGRVLEHRVARLLNDVRCPIAWGGRQLMIGASAGVAITGDPHCYDAEELSAIADEALYAAKAAGRGVMRTGGAARHAAGRRSARLR